MSRPKVLFVTYGFPPARRAGCVRTWNIAKYLARSGWAVTVLTLDSALHRVVEPVDLIQRELAREGIDRLSTGHRWRWLASDSVNWPNDGLPWLIGAMSRRGARYFGIDSSIGWIKPAVRAARALSVDDVDIVLASGPPFSAFSVAQRLARRFQCPYVLDYRDLWSRHLHFPVPGAVRKEATVLAGCAAITIVSPSWGQVLARDFGVGEKVRVVSNGYDPEELAGVAPHNFGHPALVYTGSLWPPKRGIAPVFAALRPLKDGLPHWMFHYYGRHKRYVWEEAERFGITERVIVNDAVPRSRALAAVRGAAAAIVVTSLDDTNSLEDNGMVTGKIFEAIGLGSRVVLVAPAGSDANAVAETSGLGRSFAPQDINGITAVLSEAISGKSLEPKDPAAYAWSTLVGDLDGVLRRAMRG